MIKGLIFDLDQTMIDSTVAENLRHQRNWSEVYKLIPSFKLYDGMNDVIAFIRFNHLRACVVTTSPSVYANKVIAYFNFPIEFTIDYFATTRKKPFPDPMNLAAERFNLDKSELISFGDRAIDIQSSNAAGIKSVACTWGTKESNLLLNSGPSIVISSPLEIRELIK
jgi:HAD superfamily hydrolase (TIGR01509 family)